MNAREAIDAKQKIVKQKLNELEERLKEDGELLTKSRKEILNLSFNDLLDKLKTNQLSAVTVLQAFQAKAMVETRRTNCVTEFVPQAEEWAKERDSLKLIERGLLHGLPVSIKENFDIVGMETTLGLAKNIGHQATTSAALVTALMNEGAVPFVKTNVPQIIYSAGCSNPIYGKTLNPHDLTRSPGGSSGGEAALIAGGGSFLGVGSDMTGSIRIPSALCGVYGIKPTQKRISHKGSYGTYKCMIGVANSSGFLGINVDALAAGMRAIWNTHHMSSLDAVLPPIPWNDKLYRSTGKLCIGWLDDHDFLPSTPGCKRAVNIAKDALLARGHDLVPFKAIDLEEWYDIGLDVLLSEGGAIMMKHWEGEIIDESVETNKKLMSASKIVKWFSEMYLSIWSPIMSKFASQNAAQSQVLWDRVSRLKELKDKLIESWKRKHLDALLCPSFPLPAPHASQLGKLMGAAINFAVFNLCDFPAGVVPVTHQTTDDEKNLQNYPITDYIFSIIKEESLNAVGLPLSVQVVGLPWKEELVLRTMREIQITLEKEEK